jgi:hypothetical protein
MQASIVHELQLCQVLKKKEVISKHLLNILFQLKNEQPQKNK